MKKYRIRVVLLSIVFLTGLLYGIFIGKYQVFPYDVFAIIHKQVIGNRYGPWSIGIYEGSTPFDLAPPEDISNPILTGKDAFDIDAVFVADPFMTVKDGKYYLFFEILNRENGGGDIAYAESVDGKQWHYKKVVIDEEFHLSYPHVFEWDNRYFMVPESYQDFSVRLYKAVEFPETWEYLGNLLSGYEYVDPTIFRYENKWWMFVTTPRSDILNLYFSKDLLSGWRPHPMNPVVKGDKNFSRPGGRIVVHDDKLYRLTQDDEPSYGIQVFAFETTELTETSYVEKLASTKPIVKDTGSGWNAAGMHHVDLHNMGNKWISVVDGRDR